MRAVARAAARTVEWGLEAEAKEVGEEAAVRAAPVVMEVENIGEFSPKLGTLDAQASKSKVSPSGPLGRLAAFCGLPARP